MKEKLSRLMKIVLIALILSSQITPFNVRASTGITYKMATDSDFSGTADGWFSYIGNSDYVEIPHVIKGVSITSYQDMFRGTSVKGVKSTNKNVTNMIQMFYGAQSDKLDLSELDTSNVSNMFQMFSNSQSTELDLSNFDTSSVTNMYGMFMGSQATELDLSNFNTSKVTDMDLMFQKSQATKINLSSFDTSNLTTMSQMFYQSQATEIDISNFDTSRVTSMANMFRETKVTKLDLSSFDMTTVTNTSRMFSSSSAVRGFARTQEDADILNASSGKPKDLLFVVYEDPSITLTPNGSTSWSKEHTFTISAEGYDPREPIQIAWSTSKNNQGLNWTDAKIGSNTVNGLNGNLYLHIRLTDLKGNPFYYVTSNVFKFDNEAPTITVSNNGGDWAKERSTKITATDLESGLSKVTYKWSASATPTASGWVVIDNGTIITTPRTAGNHYLHVRATDNLGNRGVFSSDVFRVDGVRPTQPTITALSGWQKSNQTVTIEPGTDAASGVAKTEYRLNSGTWNTYNEALSITTNGDTIVDARTHDKAGNISAVAKVTVQVDKESPTLTLTPNTTKWTKGNVTVTVNAQDSYSGLKRVTVSSENLTVRDVEDGKFVATENGTYTVVAEDNVGNITTKTIAITNIHKTPPTVTVNGDFTTWLGGSLVIRVVASSDISIKSLTLPDGSVRVDARVDYTVFENGDYTFIVEDVAGNIVERVVEVRNIDTVKPTLTLTKDKDTWVRELTLTATATDDQSGVDQVNLVNEGSNKNLLSMRDVLDSSKVYGTEPIEFKKENGRVSFKNGEDYYSGVSIPYLRGFKEKEDYVLSFDITKLNGHIPILGGHLKFSDNTKVYIDGVEVTEGNTNGQPNTWSRGVRYPNDTLKHHVEVQFRTEGTANVTDKSIAIQPNRLYGDIKNVQEYRVQIENLQIEQGLRSTQYTPSKLDTQNGDNPLKVKVNANGVYTFEAVDLVGNKTTKAITVNNVDDKKPTLTLTPSTTDWVNSSVTVNVNAQDGESGIRRVYVLGETMVKNNDFREGFKHWSTGSESSDMGDVEVLDNSVVLKGNSVGNNRFYQNDVFKDSIIGSRYYAEVSARGYGLLNTRYGVRANQTVPPRNSFYVTGDTFSTYRYIISKTDVNNTNLIVEKNGEGNIEINRVDVFSEKDIEDGKFEVTRNGLYTVVAEDNVGNTTTKTIEVNNVDKQPPVLTVTPSTTNETTSNVLLTVKSSDTGSGVKQIQLPTGKWVNGSEATFEVNDNGSYTIKVEDNAGNVTTKTHTVNNIIRTRTFDAPTVDAFSNIVLPNETTEYTTNVSPLEVSDWTLANDTWRVMVSATQFKTVDGKSTFPTGSLVLQPVKTISKPSGVVTGGNSKQAIDKGAVEVLKGTDTFGEITAQFGQDALGLTIDPSIVKQGTYRTTITWSLVTAP